MIINGVRSTTVDLSIGGPQGSALGPLLFLVYVTPLRSVIEGHPRVRHHGYADDRQLYTQFHQGRSLVPPTRPGHVATGRRYSGWRGVRRRPGSGCSPTSGRSTVTRRSSWSSHLRTTRPPTERCSRLCTCALAESVCMQSSLRNPGIIMDSTMDMHGQILSVKCAMSYHLRTISNIRSFLDRDTCAKPVLSLVISRVNYCNSLLVGQSAAALPGTATGPELCRSPGDRSAPA